MPTNQDLRQQSVRAATGTAYFHNDDWLALFRAAGITSGGFDDRLKAYLNARMGTSYQNINDAKRAFATSQGFTSWNAMGTFDASGTPAAPVNINAPSISGVNYYTGTTLTADPGLWSGSPASTYTYQWKRDGVNIASATGITYALVSADETKTITVAVTATNTQGNATATSAGVLASAVPVVSDGHPVFTSSATQTVAENSAFSLSLTTDIPSTFTIVGGADQALFDLSGSTVDADAFDYELPADADGNNVYLITVRATSVADPSKYTDQAITLTVTNVAEGVENGWVFVGDSITRGYAAGGGTLSDPYPAQFSVITGKPSINQGVDGRTLETMDTNYATEAAPQFTGTYNGVMIGGGINDIYGAKTDLNLRTYMQSICAKARTTGFKIAVATLTPVTAFDATQEGYRTAFNTWLRANYATFADYLIDYAGTLTSAANTVFFQSDGLHPALAGAAEMANLAASTLGYTRVTDTTAPTIYSTGTGSTGIGVDFSFILQASEKVTWSKSGADASSCALSGSTNAIVTFAAPSTGTKNVTFTATDVSGNTANLSFALTVGASYTNLFTAPTNNASDSSWTRTNLAATANAATAPDGTTTATTLREVTDYPSDRFTSAPSITTSAQNYTYWVDVKGVGNDWLGITVQDNTYTTRYARFNLTTGAVGTCDAAFASTPTITPLANGYYRCKVQMLAPPNVGRNPSLFLLTDGTTSTNAGSHVADPAVGFNISDAVMAVGLI